MLYERPHLNIRTAQDSDVDIIIAWNNFILNFHMMLYHTTKCSPYKITRYTLHTIYIY